jgi:hypothetical protein
VDVIRIASASHFIPHANPRDENQTETPSITTDKTEGQSFAEYLDVRGHNPRSFFHFKAIHHALHAAHVPSYFYCLLPRFQRSHDAAQVDGPGAGNNLHAIEIGLIIGEQAISHGLRKRLVLRCFDSRDFDRDRFRCDRLAAKNCRQHRQDRDQPKGFDDSHQVLFSWAASLWDLSADVRIAHRFLKMQLTFTAEDAQIRAGNGHPTSAALVMSL